MADTSAVLRLPDRSFARSLHVSPRLGLAYVSNPKAACSTIKLTLQRAETGDPDFVPEGSVHKQTSSPLLTWPETRDLQELALEGRFVFSFVRDPWERLRSVYLNKIVSPQKKGALREAAGFGRFDTPGFADFVAAVCAQDPQDQNPHWRLQSLNLSVDVVKYDYIGHLERFSRDWSRLADLQPGLPRKPSFAGRRSGKDAKDRLDFPVATAALVRRAYAEDFSRFGYDPTPPGAS